MKKIKFYNNGIKEKHFSKYEEMQLIEEIRKNKNRKRNKIAKKSRKKNR